MCVLGEVSVIVVLTRSTPYGRGCPCEVCKRLVEEEERWGYHSLHRCKLHHHMVYVCDGCGGDEWVCCYLPPPPIPSFILHMSALTQKSDGWWNEPHSWKSLIITIIIHTLIGCMCVCVCVCVLSSSFALQPSEWLIDRRVLFLNSEKLEVCARGCVTVCVRTLRSFERKSIMRTIVWVWWLRGCVCVCVTHSNCSFPSLLLSHSRKWLTSPSTLHKWRGEEWMVHVCVCVGVILDRTQYSMLRSIIPPLPLKKMEERGGGGGFPCVCERLRLRT